jgi:hypothetical protein
MQFARHNQYPSHSPLYRITSSTSSSPSLQSSRSFTSSVSLASFTPSPYTKPMDRIEQVIHLLKQMETKELSQCLFQILVNFFDKSQDQASSPTRAPVPDIKRQESYTSPRSSARSLPTVYESAEYVHNSAETDYQSREGDMFYQSFNEL